MKTSDPLELVNRLNAQYYDETLNTEHIPFSYSTDGFAEVIYFFEWPLWSSECEGYSGDDDSDDDIYLTDIVYKLYVDHVNAIRKVDPHTLFFAD